MSQRKSMLSAFKTRRSCTSSKPKKPHDLHRRIFFWLYGIHQIKTPSTRWTIWWNSKKFPTLKSKIQCPPGNSSISSQEVGRCSAWAPWPSSMDFNFRNTPQMSCPRYPPKSCLSRCPRPVSYISCQGPQIHEKNTLPNMKIHGKTRNEWKEYITTSIRHILQIPSD